MAELLVRTGMQPYAAPEGDPGWFGPDSVTWQVHSDLASMLIGGLSSLFLQSLHPLVMQGVADHSDYRSDPFGRLRRTAEFIAATTYGGDELASSTVRKVRAIHRRVRSGEGAARPYSASDPALLAYVHVTETWSFLRSYQRYSGSRLLTEEKNRYLAEMATVASRLGAGDVPVTTAEVRRYLAAVRPQLSASEPALATARFLTRAPGSTTAVQRAAYATICEAAIDLLPGWARSKLGLVRPSPVRIALVRPCATVLATGIRFVAGGSPILATARERASA